MIPKGSQKVTKMHLKIHALKMLPKRCQKRSIPHLELEPFWDDFSLKTHSKINAKTNVEKVCEIIRKCFQNDANTRSKINGKAMIFRNLRFPVFAKSRTLKSADPRSRVRTSIWGEVYLPPTPLRPGGRQNPAAEPSEGLVEKAKPLGRVG